MIKASIILTTLAAVIVTSCSTNTPSTNKKAENTYGIVLEDNKKWAVNAEMMVHIKAMQTNLDAIQKYDSLNYLTLGEQLQENINELTSNCTMTGKAHDELHKWLVPLINNVKSISNTNDSIIQKQALAAISANLNDFKTYFK